MCELKGSILLSDDRKFQTCGELIFCPFCHLAGGKVQAFKSKVCCWAEVQSCSSATGNPKQRLPCPTWQRPVQRCWKVGKQISMLSVSIWLFFHLEELLQHICLVWRKGGSGARRHWYFPVQLSRASTGDTVPGGFQ